jgi:HPt (histidine-containing phosphotransfer) domain-containing protein
MPSVINQEVLDELHLAVGSECLAGLVDVFLDELHERVAIMRLAWQNHDLDTLTAQAHVLKSTCGGVGLQRLQELAEQIDLAGQQGHLNTAQALTEQFIDAIDSSISMLNQQISDFTRALAG